MVWVKSYFILPTSNPEAQTFVYPFDVLFPGYEKNRGNCDLEDAGQGDVGDDVKGF